MNAQCRGPCLADLALPLRLEQIDGGLEHGGGAPRRGGGSFGYARHVTRRQPPGLSYARHVIWMHSLQETRVHRCVNDVTMVDDVAPQNTWGPTIAPALK